MNPVLATAIYYLLNANTSAIQTRQMGSSPLENLECLCPCKTTFGLLDLGYGHYPRILLDATCATVPCPIPDATCERVPYKVSYIYRLSQNSTKKPRYTFDWPESLKPEWGMGEVVVHTGCVPKTAPWPGTM